MPFIPRALPERARFSLARSLWPGGAFLLVLGQNLLLGLAMAAAVTQETRTAEPAQAKQNVPEGLNFAHGLLRQRKFDLAADEYRKFLESGPSVQDTADARFGLANALLFQGRYKEARRAFEDFLDQSPSSPRARTAWYRVGELAYMLGDLPAARKALEVFVRGASRHPNLETAWAYLGDVCLGSEDLPRHGRPTSDRSPTSQMASLPIAPALDWAERSRIWARSIWPSRFFPS